MHEIKMFKSFVPSISQLKASIPTIGSMLFIGAVNMSEIWALMQEVLDNSAVIIGLIIMGVTISIALYMGDFIKGLLKNAIRTRK